MVNNGVTVRSASMRVAPLGLAADPIFPTAFRGGLSNAARLAG